jgi:hypothetical protein
VLDRRGWFLLPAALCLCLLAGAAAPASAQVPAPAPPPAHAPAFLTRTDFSFLGATFITPDPRFTYDGRLTGDLDVIDYGVGRTNLLVDYEAVIGSERRRFDVNHGNYTIAMSTSLRTRPVEVAVIFHHVSRHLSDRSNPMAISWNVIGVRAERRFTLAGGSTIDAAFDTGKVTQPAFIDYRWISNLHLNARRPVNSRVAMFASAAGELIGVNRETAGRERQCGARGEAGFHFTGEKGAFELFAGYERRIDAFPTERTRGRFFTLGFRILTK